VAARGEVLQLKRAIGFLPGERLELFLVVQSDRLAKALDTVLAVPLDKAHPDYAGLPGIVGLGPAELGERKARVAVVPQLTCLPLERFELHPAARVKPATLIRIDRVIKLVLDLD
jgi:mRNA-degrading endonuclease toxin of MazEF toxin-antitoxin module